MLRADHGKPLRAVVPGQIGGRSVKWLKKLIITEAPSDNWYHIYDNRVLPTTVSPEESVREPKWWKDERYAIYDLSTNSAIVYPAHDEKISLISGSEIYQARGYAYGGGGRRISRVEISLNKGFSWRLADIDYPEDRYRDFDQTIFGGRVDMSWRETSFCWCFWMLEIRLDDLARAKDIVVRAMDDSMNVQPRDMYWNVLGMMNNPWFRVTVSKADDFLKFEHPTQPALMPGGWMQRVKEIGGDLTDGYWGEGSEPKEKNAVAHFHKKEIVMTSKSVQRMIALDELREHGNGQDPWFVINGEVYEGTSFMEKHPGGAQSIVSAAGLDCSDEFLAIRRYHEPYFAPTSLIYSTDSETAKLMMSAHHLGTLDEGSKLALKDNEAPVHESDIPSATFLNPRLWKTAIFHSKKPISWNAWIFTFKLEHENQTIGLPVGQHLLLRLRDCSTRETIIRPYTPIPTPSQKGYIDFLIKLYLSTEKRTGGKMSKALDAMPLNHRVELKGPIGKFQYLGRGYCSINNAKKRFENFGLICAGSGITPVYQILHSIISDPGDQTKCTLINGNRRIEDILCRDDIESFIKRRRPQLNAVYTLTQATNEWKGLRGRIDADLIKRYYQNDGRTLILVCGPAALERNVHVALNEQGWPDKQILFF